MKKLFQAVALFSLCMILWGCPYESPYALDLEPQQPIDENLLGKWAAMVKRPSYEGQTLEAPVKMIFETKSEMEYRVSITGYIHELKPFGVVESDTIRGSAYLSQLDNRRFLNLIVHGRVYIAELQQTQNTISLLALAEHFTSKFIRSCSDLRKTVSIHYRTRPVAVYDQWFLLKNMQKVN
jgi:hypothetical protein